MAYENDIYTRNEESELAVRVVTSTEERNNSTYDDVFTRDSNGKLAVRVVGAGGGDSHNLGWFATPEALREMYPTGESGDYAIVGSTDTVWTWDEDTTDWVNTGSVGMVQSVNGQTGTVTLTASDVGAQPTLVSGTNIKSVNGNSLLGSGNLQVSGFQEYPDGWTTDGTTKAFCDDIAADSSAVKGMAYLGEVTCSDLPAGILNSEIRVYIEDGTTSQDKVIVLEMTSGNVSPYRWQYTYWEGGVSVSGWKTWQEPLVSGTNIKTINNTSLLGSGNITVDSLPTQSGQSGKYLMTDGTDASWGSISFPVSSVNNQTGAVTLTASDVGALPDNTHIPADPVQADWDEADSNALDYIKNKPTIPAAQVNSDWNAVSGVAQILNKPSLATVATSGSYTDLTNTPSIPAAQVNSDWNSTSGVSEILNKPSLAAVATSGSYSDLINTPSIPAAQVNSDWNSSSGVSEILNKPSLATVATSGAYSDLTGTPTIPSKAADVNAIPQLSTLPTADSTNVGQLVQFSGTTGTYTNGYFYTSTYDSGAGTYSWVQTDVQPAGGGGSLPDQTGNAGKFLTTDGTDASWANALANESTSSSSISIGSSLSKGNSVALGYNISMGGTSQYAVLVGNGVYTNKVYATAIGPSARVEGSSGTAIGNSSQANGISSVALGNNAVAQSNYSIQLGKGTNSTIGSLSVALALDNSSYNNYTLLTVDGLIPADRIASTTGLTDGNYRLRLTMSNGTPTLSWVAE